MGGCIAVVIFWLVSRRLQDLRYTMGRRKGQNVLACRCACRSALCLQNFYLVRNHSPFKEYKVVTTTNDESIVETVSKGKALHGMWYYGDSCMILRSVGAA